MQDATTSESEREMVLILMSCSSGGALMAWGESGRWEWGEGGGLSNRSLAGEMTAVCSLKVMNSACNHCGVWCGW